MWDDSVRENVEKVAREVVAAEGFELVEAKVNLRGRSRTLTFFIDEPGSSVSLDDCVRVSRSLEDAFDRENLVEGGYVLEVSSPGLDRVLRGEEDFRRFRGRRARLDTRNPIQDRRVFRGILGEVDGGALSLDLDSGETVRIPLDEISAARLEVVL